jgi:hypothetical protein
MEPTAKSWREKGPVVGAAVGLAVLFVGAYVYGVLGRGDVLDPSLVVVIALIGLFIGWLLFALVGERRPDRGDDSDGGGGVFDGRR